jgi:hypothetical protein
VVILVVKISGVLFVCLEFDIVIAILCGPKKAQIFRKKMSSPSSVSENKISEKPVEVGGKKIVSIRKTNV